MVIIGAGLTGLGAAHRLSELGVDDYVVLEANAEVGGLARSFRDDAGFTYDVGGHVFFSHYGYYDRVVKAALGDEYTELDRQAWIWIENRFVGYPFQNSLAQLSPATTLECILGLIEAERQAKSRPASFDDWMERVFGAGITKHFMRPYNCKVWATPPELMSYQWIAERVSVPDLETVLRGVIANEPPVAWGPNGRFRYPRHGGTGTLCQRIAEPLHDRIELCCPVVSVDPRDKVVYTADARAWRYDMLLNTMPLNRFVALLEHVPNRVATMSQELAWTGTHVVGIGLNRPAGTDKNWIYFPEPDVPFHRVTYLSNYSPYMTPEPDQTLLLAETSYSKYKPTDRETIVDHVVDGLVHAGLLRAEERHLIISRWRYSAAMTYPVPTRTRDDALCPIHAWLTEQDIASRGRFGAWLYEVGNMDHSFMQGVEWVDFVLSDEPETTWIAPREHVVAARTIKQEDHRGR